jgi:hypothetical protein
VSSLLDRLIPGRVEARRRREFFDEYERGTTCATCQHTKIIHSVVQTDGPCRLRDCACTAFVWPDFS